MKSNKVNIAIIGLGNIGSHLYKSINLYKREIYLKTGKIPIIKYVSAKNKRKKRSYLSKKLWVNNPLSIVKKKDVKVIFELIGGKNTLNKKIVEYALKNKKHVITANKFLIANHGNYLSKLAEKNRVNLEYEASVGGGIPLIRSIKDGLIGNKINRITGILNGTTNYILSQMEKTGKSFQHILQKAKLLGYAETNPVSDINGEDISSKIRILSSICFNNLISNKKFLVQGIKEIEHIDILNANNLGYKIKFLGISEIIQKKLFERVYPALVKKSLYIANVDGVTNGIIVNGDPVGQSVLQGEGAGKGPTTSALISDLCSILRGNIKYPFGESYKFRKSIKNYNYLLHRCSAYLRIEVVDKYGVLSSITNTLAKNKISIKRVVQKPNKKTRTKTASIIIITHESLEKNFNSCLKKLKNSKYVLKNPVYIRIEKI